MITRFNMVNTQLRFGNNPSVRPGNSGSNKPLIVSKGDVLPPTEAEIKTGTLHLLEGGNSPFISRDIWMVKDSKTGQGFAMLIDHENWKSLDDLYDKIKQWGKNAKIRVKGIATKPLPRQEIPFIKVSEIGLADNQ